MVIPAAAKRRAGIATGWAVRTHEIPNNRSAVSGMTVGWCEKINLSPFHVPLIAAHARATESVLVTNNGREFERVPGLQVQNWVSAH